jgi:hypothetical protein
MSSDKATLPAAVIASLYKNSIVMPETESIATTKKTTVTVENTPTQIQQEEEPINEAIITTGPLKYLGEHKKNITIVVNDANAVYLNEDDFILLTSILNACKLTIADIALINIAKQSTSLHQCLNELPSTHLIAFDITPEQLKVKLPSTIYKAHVVGDTTIVFSEALFAMRDSSAQAKQEKAKLWQILKSIFKL